MNIVFPESGMQLESNHDDEGNENIDLMCITLFGKLFRDLHWQYALAGRQRLKLQLPYVTFYEGR